MSEIYQGNFQSLFISQYLGSNFTEKKRNRWRKYQEADEQIQAFTDEN